MIKLMEVVMEKVLYFIGYVTGTYCSMLVNELTLERVGHYIGVFYKLVGLKINRPKVNGEVRITTKGDCWFYRFFKPPYKVCRALFGFDRGLVHGLSKKRFEHSLMKSLALNAEYCEFHTRKVNLEEKGNYIFH